MDFLFDQICSSSSKLENLFLYKYYCLQLMFIVYSSSMPIDNLLTTFFCFDCKYNLISFPLHFVRRLLCQKNTTDNHSIGPFEFGFHLKVYSYLIVVFKTHFQNLSKWLSLFSINNNECNAVKYHPHIFSSKQFNGLQKNSISFQRI